MSSDAEVRKQLTNLLTKRQAHFTFEDVIADFPESEINTVPPNMERSFWHLLEHIRITQWDILDYIRNPDYQYIQWPAEYWPPEGKTATLDDWNHTVEQFLSDRQALVDIVNDPDTDLYAQIPHGEEGHTILREIHVAAGHNSFHMGEFSMLRGVMDLWPADHQ